MLILRVAEFIGLENDSLLFVYQKEKYTFLNEESKVLTLNEIYLITINDRGEISYVTEIETFSPLIITNMLSLSNEEILSLILRKEDIFKEYIYLQYSKEIEQSLNQKILNKSKIVGNLKVGSSYTRYYKAGEANDETRTIKIETIYDNYIADLASLFKYDKKVSVYYEPYHKGYEDDIKKYEDECKKIEKELKKHVSSLYNASDHRAKWRQKLLQVIYSDLKHIISTDNKALVKLWRYSMNSVSSPFNFKFFIGKVINDTLLGLTGGKSIMRKLLSQVESEFREEEIKRRIQSKDPTLSIWARQLKK